MNKKPTILRFGKSEIPYALSLTEPLELIIKMGSVCRDKVCSIVIDLLKDFEKNPHYKEAKDSLKLWSPGDTVSMRQVDIKNDDGNIAFKTFTYWNHKLDCWHVCIEMPNEDFFEKNQIVPEMN